MIIVIIEIVVIIVIVVITVRPEEICRQSQCLLLNAGVLVSCVFALWPWMFIPQGSQGPNNSVLGFRIKGSFKGIYKGSIRDL